MKRHLVIPALLLTVACGGTEWTEATELEDVGEGESALSGIVLEAERLALPSSLGSTFSDGAASAGSGLLIWSTGAASADVTLPAVTKAIVRARGDLCDGSPTLVLKVNGNEAGRVVVSNTRWQEYEFSVSLPRGAHKLEVAFPNDHRTRACDRNLRLDRLTFVEAPSSLPINRFEAETMTLASGAGMVFGDASASEGKALLIWSNATASARVETRGAQRLAVKARGDLCSGAPRLVVKIDGSQVLSQTVEATSWTEHGAEVSLADGAHLVEVSFTNDYSSGCDRNLRIDSLSFSEAVPGDGPQSPPATSGNPFASSRFYVPSSSPAKAQADAWRSSRPADAAQIDKIAQNPIAIWLGEWSGDVETHVRGRVTEISAAGALPVFVAYNIPLRDCGSHSAGGVSSADAYRTWIGKLRAGIGAHKAVVVLEPDAVALTDCLSSSDRQTRYSLLTDAILTLQTNSSISVYLDAGHSRWHSPSEMAARLQSAGIAHARGFALNVSNYNDTSAEVAYGKQISAALGGKSFLVDTSRNGQGGNGEWCNPSGRGLGPKPTALTGDSAVDAFFWIKAPGESDGTCNGGPSAGQWWADYALGLAQRSSW